MRFTIFTIIAVLFCFNSFSQCEDCETAEGILWVVFKENAKSISKDNKVMDKNLDLTLKKN